MALKLESFRTIGIQKIIKERGWESTISIVTRFVAKVVHKFDANLNDNIVVPREEEFKKVYVRGHIYDFSPRAICTYLNIPIHDYDQNAKAHVLDDVAIELLGYKFV